ncbi:MAG: hypothetical protein IJQ34_04220 [Kiritimatiellae bacterium]|nr:hypothetical protein [Kiritimatiellia bacterium]
MSIQVNTGANAVNWDALLSKIGEVTKTESTEGVHGATSVTITSNVNGVETPVTIRIPDDLELPGEVDQAAIDSLCDKLAADTGLNLSKEQIAEFRSALNSALQEVLASAPSTTGAKSIKGAMFDLYALMALLVEVAQKQRDATREMRLSENLSIQKSILNQADAQRSAALTGMIGGAICCAMQVGLTLYSFSQQAKAFNAQLGTEKTSGLDVAGQNVDMIKAANTQINAENQLSKVKAEIGGQPSLTQGQNIKTKVESNFSNQQTQEANLRFNEAKAAVQAKTELSGKMRQLSSDAFINDVTSDVVAPFDGPEVTGVKTAVAKLDAFKAEAAKLDNFPNMSEADKQFFMEKSVKPFDSLGMADKAKLMDIKMRNMGLDNVKLGDKSLVELKADVKAAFDDAITTVENQLAPNGQLKTELDLARDNLRAQVKLNIQKFGDSYDAALKNYNEVSKTGTKTEIEAASKKLDTAAGELKYARALGYSKLMSPDVTDAKTHLADVEGARAKYNQAHTTRANSVDYIKASNAINRAQAQNNLISAVGSFGQSFIQSISQYQQAEATKVGAEQKKAEEELDQTRDLFNQAEELVNNIVQLMNAVRQAEMQSMRDAIQA